MSHDDVAALLLVSASAMWAAFQLSIAATLFKMVPRWHGVAALVVPPLAVYWAIKRGLYLRAGLWLFCLALWVCVRLLFAR